MSNEKEKSLQELQAYRNRLVADVQRINAIDPVGANRNSPLVRNLQRVEEEIRKKKNNG